VGAVPRGHPSRRAPCKAWLAPQDEGFLWSQVRQSEENQRLAREVFESGAKSGETHVDLILSPQRRNRRCTRTMNTVSWLWGSVFMESPQRRNRRCTRTMNTVSWLWGSVFMERSIAKRCVSKDGGKRSPDEPEVLASRGPGAISGSPSHAPACRCAHAGYTLQLSRRAGLGSLLSRVPSRYFRNTSQEKP
jgi:hypothetical protein